MNFTAKDIASLAAGRRVQRLAKEAIDRHSQEQFVLMLMLNALVTDSYPSGDSKYHARMKSNALRIFKDDEARLKELLEQAVPGIEVREINIYDYSEAEGSIHFSVKESADDHV